MIYAFFLQHLSQYSRMYMALSIIPITLLSYTQFAFASEPSAKPDDTALHATTDLLEFSETYRSYQRDFVRTLLPAIQQSNQKLENDRAHIEYLKRLFKQRKTLSVHDQLWLLNLAETYRVKETSVTSALFKHLLLKVDVIPVELVLAQAAIESAWGKSRFANEGNNYFGVWCYTRGCGIVPAQRPAGQKQEVRKYASPAESVAHYMLTLNRVKAYKALRHIRHTQRVSEDRPTGHAMAAGLNKYSAKGWQYVKIVRSVIRKYQFEQLIIARTP